MAADQPLAGVAGVGDLGEVLGIEQAHLQGAVIFGQGGDGGGLQRGDPAHPVQLAQVVDPGAGDHPAVADHDQGSDAEVAADPHYGGLERVRVCGVAGEHLDRDRAALRVGEQPVLDLLAAAPAVAGVPERGQLAVTALHPGRGQAGHRDPARPQVAGSQLLLDLPLPARQPVHRGVDLIGAGAGHAQVGSQGRVAGLPPARGGQLRPGPHRPGHDQRVGDVPFPARRAQQPPKAQCRCHHVRRRDVAVRHRPLHLERLAGRHQGLAPQHLADRLQRRVRQRRQVRQGFLAGPALLITERMAQQVRPVLADRAIRRSLVTTDGVHVHRTGTPSHKLRIPQLIPAVKNSTDYTSGSASRLHAGQTRDRPQRSRKFGLRRCVDNGLG